MKMKMVSFILIGVTSILISSVSYAAMGQNYGYPNTNPYYQSYQNCLIELSSMLDSGLISQEAYNRLVAYNTCLYNTNPGSNVSFVYSVGSIPQNWPGQPGQPPTNNNPNGQNNNPSGQGCNIAYFPISFNDYCGQWSWLTSSGSIEQLHAIQSSYASYINNMITTFNNWAASNIQDLGYYDLVTFQYANLLNNLQTNFNTFVSTVAAIFQAQSQMGHPDPGIADRIKAALEIFYGSAYTIIGQVGTLSQNISNYLSSCSASNNIASQEEGYAEEQNTQSSGQSEPEQLSVTVSTQTPQQGTATQTTGQSTQPQQTPAQQQPVTTGQNSMQPATSQGKVTFYGGSFSAGLKNMNIDFSKIQAQLAAYQSQKQEVSSQLAVQSQVAPAGSTAPLVAQNQSLNAMPK